MTLKQFIPVAVLLACQIYQLCSALQGVDMSSGQTKHLVLPKHKFITISVKNVTNGTTYMLQLHSQIYNMTLCSSPIMTHDACKNGTDIGIYTKTPSVIESGTAVMWYARINSTLNETTVLASLQVIEAGAPIPGGCNQVFNLEYDANIQLTYHHHQTRLFFQWANEPVMGHRQDCDSVLVDTDLEYEFYVYFLEGRSLGLDSYLEGVAKMMTVGNIRDHGQKIESIENEAAVKPEIFIASEASRGAIYTIVVRSGRTGLSSAYVTAVTYGCSFELGTCSFAMSTGDIIIITLCFLAGAYLLLLGHRMFTLSQFVFGYLFTFLLVFLLMSMAYTVHRSVIFGIAGCMGVIGGLLCLVFWYFCFFPIASVMVPGVCAGYLVSATLFFTPFGRLEWWESNENYILAFLCAVLMYAVLLMAFSKFLSILSSCLVGSFLTLMVIAVPLRSSLRLIYLYTEYRQTEKDFEKVKPVSPMAVTDILLLTLWPIVMVLGMVFQYYREKGRPDFERFDLRWRASPSIDSVRKRPGSLSPDGEVDPLYDTDTEVTDGGDSGEENERSRLLPSPPPRSEQLPHQQHQQYQGILPSSNSFSNNDVRSPLLASGTGISSRPSYQSVVESHDAPRVMREIC